MRMKHPLHDLRYDAATLDLESLVETAFIAKHATLRVISGCEKRLHHGGTKLDAETLYSSACDLYVAVASLEALQGCRNRAEINVLKAEEVEEDE